MGTFELSPAVFGVVKRLADLKPTEFDVLKSALSTTKLTFSVDELASQVSEKVEVISIDQAEGILRTLMSIFSAHRDTKLDWNELLDSFMLSLAGELSEIERRTARQRLLALVQNSESIQLIAKAMDVYNEHERVFRASRIISDVRPIFRDDDKRLSLGAGAIVHSLKMQYQQGRQFNEIYLALDDDDLETLADDIVRAKEKSKLLNDLLKSSNIPFIGFST